MIYQSINQPVFERVPADARRILDLGCGGGAFGEALRHSRACSVVGVTRDEAEAVQARQRLDEVIVSDLNEFDPAPLGRFDCIVCSHVLEHLLSPERLLQRLRACLTPGGPLLIALPNVLFWRQRLEFLRGRFRYTEGGLMDSTHYRFFDWETARGLVIEGGLSPLEQVADGGFPLSRWLGPNVSRTMDRWAVSTCPGLFGHQFVMTCRSAAHDEFSKAAA